MKYPSTIASTVFAIVFALPAFAAASGPVVKRDHRKPPIIRDHRAPAPTPAAGGPVVRDHRTPATVRDHRGEQGRVKLQRSPGTLCAGWAC